MARRNSLLENRLFKFLAIAILLLIFIQFLLGFFGLALGEGLTDEEIQEFETKPFEVNTYQTTFYNIEIEIFDHEDEQDVFFAIHIETRDGTEREFEGEFYFSNETIDTENDTAIKSWATIETDSTTRTVSTEETEGLENNTEYNYIFVLDDTNVSGEKEFEGSFVYNEDIPILIEVGTGLWHYLQDNHFYLIVVTASAIVIIGAISGYVGGSKRRY